MEPWYSHAYSWCGRRAPVFSYPECARDFLYAVQRCSDSRLSYTACTCELHTAEPRGSDSYHACAFDLSYAEPPYTAGIYIYYEGACELFIIKLCCSDGYSYSYAY